mgnify:CR=1 FL=1
MDSPQRCPRNPSERDDAYDDGVDEDDNDDDEEGVYRLSILIKY